MNTKRIFVLLLPLLILATAAFQSFDPVPSTTVDPNVNISFPPPIYLLRGDVEIRGTANSPTLIGHYIEYRALNTDFTPVAGTTGWTPATLPSNSAVADGILGVWDTTQVDDGAYEIRLAVIGSGGTTYARVSPLRIENNPPPFVIIDQPIIQPTQIILPAPTQPVLVQPTAVPTNPQVSPINVNVNVRGGDSTVYPTVGSLNQGQTADIIGRSSRGSGWWYIRLSNGRQGWVSPDVVAETGDLSNIPFVDPPPVPATPTPIPPTASPLPDMTITAVSFDRPIKQGEAFQILITVFNTSTIGVGPFSVACNFTPQNSFFSSQVNALSGNTQITVAITAQLNSGGGANTTANCAVDVNNLVPEGNETNNFFNLTSVLAPP